jgi:hypothetical protein
VETERPTYRLTLRAEPPGHDGAPATIRLRRLLKCLLRAFGFRVTFVEELRSDERGLAMEEKAPRLP